MFDRYMIETQSFTAGLVVRDRNRFRFFAADHVCRGLEGKTFRNPREAQKAVTSLLSTVNARAALARRPHQPDF